MIKLKKENIENAINALNKLAQNIEFCDGYNEAEKKDLQLLLNNIDGFSDYLLYYKKSGLVYSDEKGE